VEGRSDEDLVKACLREDRKAYGELGKMYARRIYAICAAEIVRLCQFFFAAW